MNDSVTRRRVSIFGFAIALALLNYSNSYSEDYARVAPFQVMRKRQAVSEYTSIVSHVRRWCCIRPRWLVASIEEGPFANGSPLPDLPKPILTSVVVIDTISGGARSLQLIDARLSLKGIVPFGKDCCGIVVERRSEPEHSTGSELLVWNLITDDVSLGRKWNDVDPVARNLDLSKVKLDWESDGNINGAVSSILLRTADGSGASRIPFAFREYEIALEMSDLWEGGRETRWCAPSENGAALVVFRQIRGENAPERKSQSANITLFDPAHDQGIRWIAPVTFAADASVVPIYSPWQWNSSITLQSVNVSPVRKRRSMQLAEMRFSDGTTIEKHDVEVDERFHHSGRWPCCTTRMDRLVYFVSPTKARRAIAVFKRSDQKFEFIECPTAMANEIVTVLPTDEAVVTDDYQLWAIGIGELNHGSVRTLIKLWDGKP